MRLAIEEHIGYEAHEASCVNHTQDDENTKPPNSRVSLIEVLESLAIVFAIAFLDSDTCIESGHCFNPLESVSQRTPQDRPEGSHNSTDYPTDTKHLSESRLSVDFSLDSIAWILPLFRWMMWPPPTSTDTLPLRSS